MYECSNEYSLAFFIGSWAHLGNKCVIMEFQVTYNVENFVSRLFSTSNQKIKNDTACNFPFTQNSDNRNIFKNNVFYRLGLSNERNTPIIHLHLYCSKPKHCPESFVSSTFYVFHWIFSKTKALILTKKKHICTFLLRPFLVNN